MTRSSISARDASLAQVELARSSETAPEGITAGWRYPAAVMQRIGR